MKISTFNNVKTSIVFENKKTKKNAITKNKKFKQIDDKTIQKHIKIFFFNNVNNNTNQKNSLRICKIVNSIDYKIQNFTFY